MSTSFQSQKPPISTRHNNPCHVCGDTSGDCRTSATDATFFQCQKESGSRKGEVINGYKNIGHSSCGTWGLFKPVGSWQPDTRPANERRAERELKEALNRQHEQAVNARRMPVAERHEHYSDILAQLSLHPDDRADAKRRGFSDEEISRFKSVERYQKLTGSYPLNLPGIAADGQSLANRVAGYLCPALDAEGRIQGFQIRNRHYSGSGPKYIWLSSNSVFEGGLGAHLPNGELPVGVYWPTELRVFDRVGIAENFAIKPQIAANRLGMIVIGCDAANIASRPENFKQVLNSIEGKLQTKPDITYISDAGDTQNAQVMPRIKRQYECLCKIGLEVGFLWWEQHSKTTGDVDEISDEQLERAQLISWPEFQSFAPGKAASFKFETKKIPLSEVAKPKAKVSEIPQPSAKKLEDAIEIAHREYCFSRCEVDKVQRRIQKVKKTYTSERDAILARKKQANGEARIEHERRKRRGHNKNDSWQICKDYWQQNAQKAEADLESARKKRNSLISAAKGELIDAENSQAQADCKLASLKRQMREWLVQDAKSAHPELFGPPQEGVNVSRYSEKWVRPVDLAPGRITAISAPTGTGKSTLMQGLKDWFFEQHPQGLWSAVCPRNSISIQGSKDVGAEHIHNLQLPDGPDRARLARSWINSQDSLHMAIDSLIRRAGAVIHAAKNGDGACLVFDEADADMVSVLIGGTMKDGRAVHLNMLSSALKAIIQNGGYILAMEHNLSKVVVDAIARLAGADDSQVDWHVNTGLPRQDKSVIVYGNTWATNKLDTVYSRDGLEGLGAFYKIFELAKDNKDLLVPTDAQAWGERTARYLVERGYEVLHIDRFTQIEYAKFFEAPQAFIQQRKQATGRPIACVYTPTMDSGVHLGGSGRFSDFNHLVGYFCHIDPRSIYQMIQRDRSDIECHLLLKK